jgi:hypothetical protein
MGQRQLEKRRVLEAQAVVLGEALDDAGFLLGEGRGARPLRAAEQPAQPIPEGETSAAAAAGGAGSAAATAAPSRATP